MLNRSLSFDTSARDKGPVPWGTRHRAGGIGGIAELQPPRLNGGQPPGSPRQPLLQQPARHHAWAGDPAPSTADSAGEGTQQSTGCRGGDVTQPHCLRSWHPGVARRCYSNTKPLDSTLLNGKRLVSG